MPNMPENRTRFERQLTRQLTIAFRDSRGDILRAIGSNARRGDLAMVPQPVYEQMIQRLTLTLDMILTEVFLESARNFDESLKFGIATERIQRAADEWSDRYSPLLAKQLVDTTREALQRYANKAPDLPITSDMLQSLVTTVMSVERALGVAITEVTNAVSAGEQFVTSELERSGARVTPLWYTQVDERVCPICAPRHANPQHSNWQLPPPAHPRCRCYLGYRIESADGSVQVMFDEDQQTEVFRKPR